MSRNTGKAVSPCADDFNRYAHGASAIRAKKSRRFTCRPVYQPPRWSFNRVWSALACTAPLVLRDPFSFVLDWLAHRRACMIISHAGPLTIAAIFARVRGPVGRIRVARRAACDSLPEHRSRSSLCRVQELRRLRLPRQTGSSLCRHSHGYFHGTRESP